jgi:O-antigen ligase
MALATLMLIGLLLDKSVRYLWHKVVLAVLALPSLALMVYSGSRAGIGAFIVGASLYMLPYRKSRRKITTILWAMLFLGATVYTVVSDPSASSRWQATYEKGDTAGRDRIYTAAIEMILERPVFGWHPVASFYELGSRLNWRGGRDPHNLFLALLTEVGLVGTFPFIVGLCLCTQAAWKARLGPFGLLPLALLGTILVAHMTHSGLTDKLTWLVFAFTLAAIPTAASESGGWSRVRLEASLPE